MILNVIVLAAFAWAVDAHVCLTDPPQRLQTGTSNDCFQNGSPPCGADFPSTPSANPVSITAGTTYTVKIRLPVQHYSPGVEQNVTISIAKDVTDTFVKLGEWQDSPGDTWSFDVMIPSDASGNYILQFNYKPRGYDFYSCADIVVQDSIVG